MNEQQKLIFGIILATIGCKGYKIYINRPIYIENHRVHHYQVGLVLLLWAISKKNLFFLGLGCGLVLDDRRDLFVDLNKLIKN